MKNSFRPIAIHLPQFHPIPENDQWWGKGFTEWANVVKARPLYEGHYQPQLPSDLGFYDLRLSEAREAQAKMARDNGIYGFCYYHYWFNGKRLLERPVDEILSTGKPDFPFMLCWANENWTRRWDGEDQEILMGQNYSEEDDIEHMRHLIQYFIDPRYIRINNKPVFILYKVFLLPDPEATVKRWRQVAAEYGIELYLCHMVFGYKKEWNKLVNGFDATIDFEPFGIRRQQKLTPLFKSAQVGELNKFQRLINKIKLNTFKNKVINVSNVYEYKSMYEKIISTSNIDFKIYPSLVPGWDNTARRKNKPVLILDNSTPEFFQEWLSKIKNDFKPYSEDENLIFINAWNEWAEGNHLEPCRKWGTQYLDVVKRVFSTNT